MSISSNYLAARVTAPVDKDNDTLAAVTGLSIELLAGQSYIFRSVLFVDADAGGSQYAIEGVTLTAAAIRYSIRTVVDGLPPTEVIQEQQTALGGASGDNQTGILLTKIRGLITAGDAGSLIVQFAQNTTNATPSSVLVGSYLVVMPVA